MEKQTAVEWFNQQIVDRQNGKGDSRSWDEIYEQANQIFEQQIIEAYDKGYLNLKLGDDDAAQQYYNIKFKK